MLLEALMHEHNTFITLTYATATLPTLKSSGLATLVPEDVQLWLKRFRTAVQPTRVRFYAVGEYGDENFRPHYHVAMFGYPNCRYGNSRYLYRGDELRRSCCDICERVRLTWGKGRVFLGSLEAHSAQYIAQYVTKKMTSRDDPRLLGRHPEFSRMSNRPGIAADALWEVASTLMQFNLETSEADVPSALRHGKRLLPLGPYMKRRLRKLVGKDEKAPQEVIDQINEELRPLRQAAFDNSSSFKEALIEAGSQAVKNMEARQRIFKGKGKTL